MQEILLRYKHTIFCTILLFVLSLFGCVMVLIRWVNTGGADYLFLIWNLFLSWIPLGISILMSYIYTQNKGRAKWCLALLGLLWLLFYPNAPYMLTDYIHLRSNYSLLSWFDLVMHSVFIWTSFFIGFVSLYIVNRIVRKKTNKIVSLLFTLFILFLSSYGIYLGRIIRWNSWDMILNPLKLVNSFFENINYQSIVFSAIFGILLTLIYAFLYSLTFLKLEKID